MLLTNCFFAVRMFNNLYIIIFLNKFFIPRHTLRRTNHERIGEHQQEIRDRSHHHTKDVYKRQVLDSAAPTHTYIPENQRNVLV